MSSYRQVEEIKSLEQTLQLAIGEVDSLIEEMDELCYNISDRFPGRCVRIPKYQQANNASDMLIQADSALDAVGGLDGILDDLPRKIKAALVAVTIGQQARRRAYSWRVRCGNAVVRLKGVIDALSTYEDVADSIIVALRQSTETLEGVTFPTAYGP